MALDALQPGCAQACVTSPPYWHVRDYNAPGQIGLEPDLDEYIHALVQTLARVHRVLTDDGVLWLNIGDGYTSGGRAWRAPDKKNPNRAMETRPATPSGLKPKDLLGVPWRLALALQQPWLRCPACSGEHHSIRWGRLPDKRHICPQCTAFVEPEKTRDGWHLRSEVIWERPNCQPESVKDRPTRSHEHLFMLTKNQRYTYDNHVARGPNDRNLRTVWAIKTQPGRHGHIAPFPEALVEPCILLATRNGEIVLDPFLGSGTTAVVAQRLDRRFIGIELNAEYAEAARNRLTGADETASGATAAGR